MKPPIVLFAATIVAFFGHQIAVIGQTFRIATFNTSLNRCLDANANPCLAGGLEQVLADGEFRQAREVAELIQRIDPDVLLLNEFNYDSDGVAAQLFQENYLSVGQNASRSDTAARPINFVEPQDKGIAIGKSVNPIGADRVA